MAERDAFEVRFDAAVRGYVGRVSSDLDPAELAHRIAAAQPRRHGLAAALTWRPVAIPRGAWALLLAAGLLAAMVGGMLIAGSQREPKLPAVVPPIGQLFACPPGSTPDEPGPVAQARPVGEYPATAFDRRAGRLVVVTIAGDGVETWTFDVCTNTWVQMHPNREPPGFDWAELVYDIDSDVTVATLWNLQPTGTLYDPRTDTWTQTGGGMTPELWVYDLQADAWTLKGVPPAVDGLTLAYDPVSGLVVAGSYWTYDVESDTWTPIQQASLGPSDGAAITYDASVDRLVAYIDGPGGSPPYETWLLDIRSGSWSLSAAERPAVVAWLVGPRLVYDETAERTVVFMRDPLTAYDATADRWEVLAEADVVNPTQMVYDPVNRRLIGWGVGGNDLPEGAVEALDLATGAWTVLLEPTPGQPAP